jgi:putative restriction endonuclease
VLRPGFGFRGDRIPLVNPRRGIFKPQQMRFLLSIKTVFPKPGGKVWYDDQREVHRQIFEGDETIDYAFMRQNPDASDNWSLREAFEKAVPIIYFLGIAPGPVPGYVARVHFGMGRCGVEGAGRIRYPESRGDRTTRERGRAPLRVARVKQRLHQASFREEISRHRRRSNTLCTCVADHFPLRAVGIPCLFKPSAMARRLVFPAARNSLMIGASPDISRD